MKDSPVLQDLLSNLSGFDIHGVSLRLHLHCYRYNSTMMRLAAAFFAALVVVHADMQAPRELKMMMMG
jgi:hypothetical protein